MVTFDDLLEEAGAFGRCQKRIFALLCLVSLPFAGVYAGIVFQGFTPDHWCRDPALAERRLACGWSLADGRRLAAPLVNVSGELQRSSCERYEVDWNVTASLIRSPSVLQDGWEYDYGGRESFFDLVCSDGWLVDMYQSTLNLGFLLGSFACGFFADRCVCDDLPSVQRHQHGVWVPDGGGSWLHIHFGLQGLRFGAGWVVGVLDEVLSGVSVTEMVGVKYRRTVGILHQMFFSIGNLILPLLAYFITDWRWLQVTVTAPFVLFMSYYWLIPESPRWLISKKRLSEALQITEAIAKENKKKLSTKFQVKSALCWTGEDRCWLHQALVASGLGCLWPWLPLALVASGNGCLRCLLHQALVSSGAGCLRRWFTQALVASSIGCL
uniref:Uncharacterized protein n=1 Tax=Oryzias latipes TaxID=8090 RepID=A0A3P9ID08_ORYLA